MNKTKTKQERRPFVLLICDSNPFSIVRYLEHALYDKVNLATIYLDIQDWFPKKLRLEELFYKFFRLRLRHLTSLPRDPDLIFVVEPYVKTRLDLRRFADSVTAFYALDPHTSDPEKTYSKCKVWEYDYVFCGQRDYIPTLRKLGCSRVAWLPYAVDPAVFRELQNARVQYDVAFLGSTTGTRSEVLKKLSERFKLLTASHGGGAYYMHDASIAYSMSKIVLQISNRGTLGARIFEGMACNRLVVADEIGNGLEELLKNGKEIVLYRNLKELEEKIAYYLENEDERVRIAERGCQLVKREHTYGHRAAQVLNTALGKTHTRFLDNEN